MSPSPDPIVKQLRKARRAREWSQRQVGEQLGRLPGTGAHATVSQWEQGHRSPALHHLRAWAEVLGFDLVLVPKGRRPG